MDAVQPRHELGGYDPRPWLETLAQASAWMLVSLFISFIKVSSSHVSMGTACHSSWGNSGRSTWLRVYVRSPRARHPHQGTPQVVASHDSLTLPQFSKEAISVWGRSESEAETGRDRVGFGGPHRLELGAEPQACSVHSAESHWGSLSPAAGQLQNPRLGRFPGNVSILPQKKAVRVCWSRARAGTRGGRLTNGFLADRP